MTMLPIYHKLIWIALFILGASFIFAGGALADGGNDGAELYEFWCSTCHGDRGQGLTDEWRATWPEDKQYCWRSKCHASNHPPDGFTFPKEVPAVIGPDSLANFDNAGQLYAYVRAAMPYWDPNRLTDEQYLAITTFLVDKNYASRGLPAPLPEIQDLSSILLRSTTSTLAPAGLEPTTSALASSETTGHTASSFNLALVMTLVAMIAIGTGGYWLWRRARRSIHSP